jgi:hypothetical protein
VTDAEVADSPLRSPLLRKLLGASVALLALANVARTFAALAPPWVWLKDFRQDWLQARAIAAGLPAYEPLPALADRFIGPDHPAEFPMATPHPPLAALLCLPFGWTSYGFAAAAWLALSLGALALAARWLLRAEAGDRLPLLAMAVGASFAWHPIAEDLMLGQFGLFVNLAFVGAWLALRDGREAAGGAWLGAALALKLAGWPIVGWLVLQRRWRAVGASVLSFGLLHAVSLPVVGIDGTRRYYGEVGAQAAAIYGAYERNIAAPALARRVFEGMHSPALVGVEAPPLIDAPRLVPIASVALIGALGAATVLGAARAAGDERRRFDLGYAMFAAASLVANPIAWSSYLVAAMVPLWVAAREWRRSAAPPVVFGAVVAFLLVLPPSATHAWLDALATDGRVGFAPGLLSLVHLAGVLGLIALLAFLATDQPKPSSRPPW